MRTSAIPAIATAAVLALGLTACSDDADEPSVQETPAQTPTEETSPTEAGEPTPTPDQGAVDEASVAAAIAAIPPAEAEAGGTAFEISSDDGGWEVDVAVGDRYVEVRIDTDGGVRGTDDEGGLDRDDREGLAAAQIGIAEAIATAAATDPGGPLDDVELEREGGGHAWKVDFDLGDDDSFVYVDVVTGDVLRTGIDD